MRRERARVWQASPAPLPPLPSVLPAPSPPMNLPAVLDGRPWVVPTLLGASVLLNLTLGAALLMPRGAPATADESSLAADVVDASAEGDLAAAIDASGADGEVAAHVASQVVLPAGLEVLRASVDKNLAYTFKQAGAGDPDKLSAITARLFVWDLDLRRDLQRGDSIALAFTTEADLPVIQAARFQGSKSGNELTAYRFQATGDSFPSYWTADGTEVPYILTECPLQGRYEQITSLLKDRPTHKGMDFKVPVGTEVVSPRAGTVVRTNWNFTYNGNAVEVRYNDGTLARFLHLSDTRVKPGQALAAGAVVGLSGNTGRSTAPHLHYELEQGGRTVDPAKYHGTRRRALSAADKARFVAERERLDAFFGAGGV